MSNKEMIMEQEIPYESDIMESGSRRKKGAAERIWAPIKLKLHPKYKYINNNVFLQFLYYTVMFIGMPFAYLFFKICWGYKIINKENAKLVKHTAAITVANHVHNMDSPMATAAFFADSPHFVALPHNFEAFFVGGIVRILRGVPLPSDMTNFKQFSRQIDKTLQCTKKKVHIYPEGELVPYGRKLRPFKKGAFHFAVKNNVPVLPMTFVFSRKNKIRLIIGEPIYLDDIVGAKETKNSKREELLGDFVKDRMQQMMDEYYSNAV